MNLLQPWRGIARAEFCWPWAWQLRLGAQSCSHTGWDPPGTPAPAQGQEAGNTHPPHHCWNNGDGQNLKLLTNEPHKQPLRSTWLFFRSSSSRRKLKFHTNWWLMLPHTIYRKKTVKFLSPDEQPQFLGINHLSWTLQQGTVTKTPISPSSTACTGQWFISIQSVIFRTQLTSAKRTKEFWETWFSGKLHFLPAFPPSPGIHPNLVPQTGFHEEASLSPANCSSGCSRTKLSLFRASTLQSSFTKFTSCYKQTVFRNKSNRKHKVCSFQGAHEEWAWRWARALIWSFWL